MHRVAADKHLDLHLIINKNSKTASRKHAHNDLEILLHLETFKLLWNGDSENYCALCVYKHLRNFFNKQKLALTRKQHTSTYIHSEYILFSAFDFVVAVSKILLFMTWLLTTTCEWWWWWWSPLWNAGALFEKLNFYFEGL